MRLIISDVFSLEKYGKILENGPFFRADTVGRGYTAWVDMAGLGFIGLNVAGMLCP